MERPDLFARRNRLRIVGLIILATVVYWMAVVAAAVATGLVVIFYLISEAGVPDDFEVLKWFGYFCLAVLALSIVIGSFMSLFRLPTLRRKLEAQVLPRDRGPAGEPRRLPARCATSSTAWRSSAGVPAPASPSSRTSAPNSFGVGTRPKKTIIGITVGAGLRSSTGTSWRPPCPTRSAASGAGTSPCRSWAVALTSGAIAAAEADDLKAIVGLDPGPHGRVAAGLGPPGPGRGPGPDRHPVHPAPRGPDHGAGEAGGRPGPDHPGQPGHRPAVDGGPRRVYGGAHVVPLQAPRDLVPPPTAAHRPPDRAGRPAAPAEGAVPKSPAGPPLPPRRTAAAAGADRTASPGPPLPGIPVVAPGGTPHAACHPPDRAGPTPAPPPPPRPPERGRSGGFGVRLTRPTHSPRRSGAGQRRRPGGPRSRPGLEALGVLLGQPTGVGVGRPLEAGLDGQRHPAARARTAGEGRPAWLSMSFQNWAVFAA